MKETGAMLETGAIDGTSEVPRSKDTERNDTAASDSLLMPWQASYTLRLQRILAFGLKYTLKQDTKKPKKNFMAQQLR